MSSRFRYFISRLSNPLLFLYYRAVYRREREREKWRIASIDERRRIGETEGTKIN